MKHSLKNVVSVIFLVCALLRTSDAVANGIYQPSVIVSYNGTQIVPYNPSTGARIPAGSTITLSSFGEHIGIFIQTPPPTPPNRIILPGGQEIELTDRPIIMQVGNTVIVDYGTWTVTSPGTFIPAGTPSPIPSPPANLRPEGSTELPSAEDQQFISNFLKDPLTIEALGKELTLADVAFDFDGIAGFPIGTGRLFVDYDGGGQDVFFAQSISEPSGVGLFTMALVCFGWFVGRSRHASCSVNGRSSGKSRLK